MHFHTLVPRAFVGGAPPSGAVLLPWVSVKIDNQATPWVSTWRRDLSQMFANVAKLRSSLRALSTAVEHARKLLKVPLGAPDENIKRAFLERALQVHPDVSQEPDANARFLSLLNAKTVLLAENRERASATEQRAPRQTKDAPAAGSAHSGSGAKRRGRTPQPRSKGQPRKAAGNTQRAAKERADKEREERAEKKRQLKQLDAAIRAKKAASGEGHDHERVAARTLAETRWADGAERSIDELRARERELDREAEQAAHGSQTIDGRALQAALPRIRAHLRKREYQIHVALDAALKPLREEVQALYDLAEMLSRLKKQAATRDSGDDPRSSLAHALCAMGDEEHRAREAKLRDHERELAAQLEELGDGVGAREAAEVAAKLQLLRGVRQ